MVTTALQPGTTLQPSRNLQPSRGGYGYGLSPEDPEQLFRTSGLVRANVRDTTRWLVNGVDLENYSTILGADEGFATSAERPDNPLKLPGRHGVLDVGGTLGASQITFAGAILGVDPATGAWNPGESFGTYLQRVDGLMRLLTARTLVITAIRPDGTTRQAVGRVLGSIAPTQQAADPWFGRWRATIRIPGGMWEDQAPVTQQISGTTGTVVPLDAFAAATAPMADLTITAPGPISNPLLVCGDRSWQWNGVIASGRQLVVNTTNWTVSPGTGAAWTPDLRQVSFSPGPGWLELDPSAVSPFAVTFVHTGGGTASLSITARRKYHNP